MYTVPLSTPSLRDPRQQQYELKAQLREGLRSLPVPRNDFEIVVPEPQREGEGMEVGEGGERAGLVEDAADVDERNTQLRRKEGTCITELVDWQMALSYGMPWACPYATHPSA